MSEKCFCGKNKKHRGPHLGSNACNKGVPHSEETKKKISIGGKGKHKNQKSWNKGFTKDTHPSLKKVSEILKIKKLKPKVEMICPTCKIHFFLTPWESRKRKFCSCKCNRISPEGLKKIGDSNRGKHHSPETIEKRKKSITGKKRTEETKQRMRIAKQNISEETRKKMSESIKRRFMEHPETHPNKILSKNQSRMTFIEKITNEFLQLSGFKKEEYTYQYTVKTKKGCKFVDFAVPSLKLLIECDGEQWHKDKEKDAKRDKEILEILPEWRIEHLTGKEIIEISKWMNIEV